MGQPLTLVSGTLFGDVKKHVWGYIASCLLKRTLPPLPDGAEQFADPAARKLLDSMTSLVKEGLPLEWGTLRFRAGLSPVEMREVVELTNEFTVGDPSYHVYMLTNLIHQIRVKETARKLAADPSNE